MCGIAGFADALSGAPQADRGADDAALLQAMCDVIRHRGPDDEGIRVEPGVGLGMRRLSIIDLSTGHQPISNEDGTIWIVFNGEIYNYRSLRTQLHAAGHRFTTTTDTEVIVHAFEQWGAQAFSRLRGMFGLAIWDSRQRTLWLARDRVGIKPLYYTQRRGRLFFGSELKSLLAAGAVTRQVDRDALAHYLAFLYTPADRSIFTDVRKLPPGHVLCWRNGTARVSRYWEPPRDEAAAVDEREAVELVYDQLRDAVQSHMVSDVPLGAFLSGGLDSSLVVALMAQASAQPVRTFSIGFDEPAYDELESARLVARHVGAEHHEFVVRPDALSIVERIVTHFDEPFADSSAIPTWYVSELARRHVTVVLSGDGGDELFGGYDRYLPHRRVAQFDRLPLPGRQPLAAAAARWLPRGALGRRFLAHVARDAASRYVEAVSFFTAEDRAALLTAPWRSVEAAPERRFHDLLERDRHLPFGSRMMRLDFATYLPEDVLTKVDRMSMAHSIESRVPLLDHHVVECALRLPLATKIRNGRRKHILRQVAARLLPPEILEKKKQGFGVPLGLWFRGRLREAFMDTLQSPRTQQRGYFEPREVQRLLDEHLSGRRDHEFRLWQLLMFELWHRAYADDASAEESSGPALVAARA